MAIETPYRFKSQELQNQVINGNFDFWQRGTSFALTPNQAAYTTDRNVVSNTVPSGNLAVSRSTDVPSSAAGAAYSLLVTQSTAATFAAGSFIVPYDHRIEGINFRNIHQKVITISFWFKASIAGTYALAIRNGASTRSYVTNFSIASASTWTLITKTITLDTSGTWNLDNTIGCYLTIGANTGFTYQATTVDAWQNGNFFSSSTATNWNGTAGATVQISQVMLNLGPTAAPFALFGSNYSGELEACQRYAEVITGVAVQSIAGAGAFSSTTTVVVNFPFLVEKRAFIGLSVNNPSGFRVNNASNNYRVASVNGYSGTSRICTVVWNLTSSGINGAATSNMDYDGNGGPSSMFFDAEL